MSARRRIRTLIRYGWASTCSLIWLLLVPAGILSGASVRVVARTLDVAGGRIAAWISRLPLSLR
jgi:hypothetical protein